MSFVRFTLGLVIFALAIVTVESETANSPNVSKDDMRVRETMDEILERLASSINNLSEEVKQQERDDLKTFQEKTERMQRPVNLISYGETAR